MSKNTENPLLDNNTHPIRDILWGHVYMTENQAKLTESAPFMRLNRIMQLGPVYLVYPGATHTRASHSIGVYHIGKRLLKNLWKRGAEDWLTNEGINSFLAACLLHDLGHFPYTHSLKELSLASHESLTGEIIMKEPMKSFVGAAGADPAFTAAIIDKERKEIQSDELDFYRKLLSGALDPDKLDYLNRDARYCGVPYGAQDVDFILSKLQPDKKRGVDIDSRLIPNVESILFSKYLMYRTVYWHRQVRAITAMIKKALINGLKTGQIAGEDLYNLDDYSLFSLLKEKIKKNDSSPINGAALVEYVQEGKIYAAAAEISPDKSGFKALKNTKNRAKTEGILAEKLRKAGLEDIREEDIIIDIPEPVSFETGLFITDEKCDFSQSSSAFKPQTVRAFIQNLYTIRVYINQKFKEKLKTFPKAYSILKKLGN